MKKAFLTTLLILSGFCSLRSAAQTISVIDTAGLTTTTGDFCCNPNNGGSESITTFNGYQYAIYYNSAKRIVVARRNLATSGAWERCVFTDYLYTTEDTHNTAAIGICENDGTIHITFDHHVSPLHYRVSAVGAATNPGSVTWGPSLFGPVTDTLITGSAISGLTYPSFIPTTAGDLLFSYRTGGSGSGDTYFQKYSGASHTWLTGFGKVINGLTGSYTGEYTTSPDINRNAYPYFDYEGGRLHMAWCWRENAASLESNHDLMYAYSDNDGQTWKNSAGTTIATAGSSYITLSTAGIIIAAIPQNRNYINSGSMHVSADSTILINIRHKMTAGGAVEYHVYRRSAGSSTWVRSSAPNLGTILRNDDNELYLAHVLDGRVRISASTPSVPAWTLLSSSAIPLIDNASVDIKRWKNERMISVFSSDRLGLLPKGTPRPQKVRDYDYSSSARKMVSVLPEETNYFGLYPNPARNTLYVIVAGYTGKLRVKIFGLQGNEIINRTTGIQNTVDVSKLTPGVYMVQVSDDKKILTTQKIVINK
jgi:hypothetical protein